MTQSTTPDQYIDGLPSGRKEAMQKLRKVILENLPEGFSEGIYFGMIGYVVPHALYPAGYHTDPKQPLPYISIASQKTNIVLHHLGIYADKDHLTWFLGEYPKYSKKKPDMGKGCIRFKDPEEIPFELIGELARKVTPQEWIRIYEKNLKR